MACTISSQTSLQALRTFTRDETHNQQECIPVGCVLPMAVAICRGGVCLSACWDTPQVWAWRPPRCGPGDPPLARPNFPPGCGPGEPSQARPLNFPPWMWAWRPARHAGIPPNPLEKCKACWDTTCTHSGIPPLCEQID